MENNQTTGDLALRVEKLERSNKLLKVGLMAVVLGVGGVALMGAAPGKRIVEAEKFIFRDATGKERIVLDSSAAGPTCTLNDINGKPSFKVVINKDGYFQMPSDPSTPKPAVQKKQ